MNSELLLNNGNHINNDGTLFINIQKMNSISIFMSLKIIEDNTICLLEKNAINYGFLTSKTVYQYFYTEILKGEEGELMLHNKRQYGILHGKIVKKSDINNLNDASIYMSEEDSTTWLEYNQHTLQLKYDYNKTEQCINGCYLLITYEQIKSKYNIFPLIGYEFTILSKFWNDSDYISDLIEIPYNEYIIIFLGKGTSREHYYYIYIPDNAEKIQIQLEGNYIDVFYEEGRKRINILNESKKLNTNEDKNVTDLYTKTLNLKEKYLSFAFKPKEYNTKIISSYYFRVLYKIKNEALYLPLDSNFRSLCLPEKNDENKGYFCNLILKNDYDELSTKFIVTSTNQNEYFKINITRMYKDKSQGEDVNDLNTCIMKL